MTAVGTNARRSDGEAKVSGTADYTADISLPGMLHAAVLRSPVARGRIKHLDTSVAAAMDGVWAVVTASAAPNVRTGLIIGDQLLFARDAVTYVGEPVAAVAADSLATAKQALGAIILAIEEETPVVDLDRALDDDAPLVHPDWETYRPMGETDFPRGDNVAAEMMSDPGGVDIAFHDAKIVVEGEYRSNRQYQAYLEPKGVVAEYRSGRYILHISHQFPFKVRDRFAAALGIDVSAVRIVGHHIGGGFGAKLDLSIEPYAALLARATGRPVKLVIDRTEDLVTCQCREDAVVRIRSAVTEDGEIVARDIDVLIAAGAAGTDGPALASIPLILAGGPYIAGPTRVRCRSVYTNTAPTGAFRGVSGTHFVFAMERHMDMIANQLAIDRRELRLRNLIDDGHRLLNGQILPDASILRQAFDAVEKRVPWSQSGRKPLTGVGVAACYWLTNPLPGSVLMKLHEDGRVGLVTGATENGSGAVSMGITQIAAEELQVAANQVIVSMPDTDTAPYDAGSQGSRTTHVVGRAVSNAAVELREKIFAIAGDMLEADAADLHLVDGYVAVRGVPGTRIALAEVAAEATQRGQSIAATGAYTTPMPDFDPTCATGLLFPAFPTPTYHMHQAEVAVDPITGTVTVLRYVVAQEVGKAINPVGVQGQIQGGVAQGLGYALWENLDIDSSGRYRQQTLESYRLPLSTDVPRVESIILEHADDAGPFGAKGVAEPPIVPVAGAIANAVSDAVGSPINSIPISPEAVLHALEKSGR